MQYIDELARRRAAGGGQRALLLKHRRASSVERRALVPIWIGGACLITAFLIDAFVTGDPTQGGAAYTLFQLEDLARMAGPALLPVGPAAVQPRRAAWAI